MTSTSSGLSEIGLSNKVIQLTYSEFGRRVHENNSRGTDHGTANVHFALGKMIQGGLHGAYPDLNELDRETLCIPLILEDSTKQSSRTGSE